MTPRERVLAVLNREKVDRIPVDFWYTAEVLDDLFHYFGVADQLALFKMMQVDKIVAGGIIFDRKGEVVPDGEFPRGMYGNRFRLVKSGLATYRESIGYPMMDISCRQAIDDYPWWPKFEDFNLDKSAESFARPHQYGFATYGMWNSFLENYNSLRGIENALLDLVMEPEMVDYVLDKIEELQLSVLDAFLPKVKGVLDLVYVSDDMGSQTSLLISPEMWEDRFAPRMKRICAKIHSHGMKVFYHSDGACAPIIGRLIECGIDILNPIQHICPGMNPVLLKEKFGDKVVFHGAVDTQGVMPFGSTEDVKKEVNMLLDTLGRDRAGYICASCHNLQAGTPVENIMAMVETVLNRLYE
jgi:uroporphyrinogen decarboxylase